MAKSSAGKRDPNIRSDCYIELTTKRTGGIRIDLISKVDIMYGKSIRANLQDMCKHFGIKHAHIIIEDSGALPSTISSPSLT